MDRVAVFVDAGYLFAQGAIEMFGKKLKRSEMILDHGCSDRQSEDIRGNPLEPAVAQNLLV